MASAKVEARATRPKSAGTSNRARISVLISPNPRVARRQNTVQPTPRVVRSDKSAPDNAVAGSSATKRRLRRTDDPISQPRNSTTTEPPYRAPDCWHFGALSTADFRDPVRDPCRRWISARSQPRQVPSEPLDQTPERQPG